MDFAFVGEIICYVLIALIYNNNNMLKLIASQRDQFHYGH